MSICICILCQVPSCRRNKLELRSFAIYFLALVKWDVSFSGTYDEEKNGKNRAFISTDDYPLSIRDAIMRGI